MATVTCGYNAAGDALDWTTIPLAITNANANDTIDCYYGDNALGRRHAIGVQNIPKNLTIRGMLGNQECCFADATRDIFNVTTASVTVILENLTIQVGGSSDEAFFCGAAGITLTMNRCRIIGGTYGIAGNNGYTATVNMCEFIWQYVASVRANNAGDVVTINNCAFLWPLTAITRVAGTINCYNSVFACLTPTSGTVGGSNNATIRGTAPGTGVVTLLAVDMKTLYFGAGTYGACSLRPTSADCALVGAGTDRSLTTDIDGETIDQSASADVGPYSWAALSSETPDYPDAGNVTEDDTTNGVTGTYHEATEAEVEAGVTFGEDSGLTGTLEAGGGGSSFGMSGMIG